MKLMDFTYNKTNGEKSVRSVAVVNEPNKFIEGIDISELSNDELVDFAAEYNSLMDNYNQQHLNLLNRFDLKHNYRRFNPEQVTDAELNYV
jgi:hypothetical protein